uniref:Uncharacterized protein n=1 Tax=Oryza punctata TaxID=4537 RepID=A0A0E0LGJ3_ORYPU
MCHTVLKLFGISPYGNWVGDEEESVVSSIRVSESLENKEIDAYSRALYRLILSEL